MKLHYKLSILFLILGFTVTNAQKTGTILGTVKDKNTQETIIGAIVQIENTQLGVSSDIDGNFKISNIPVGSYNVKASIVGYQALVKFNINVTSGNDISLNFELVADNKQLKEVEITFDKGKSASSADMITPLSVQSLTTEEIRSNPGGNFDISKVIQVLPGVAGAGSASFRNDIIIRGGAPNENVFYLDGIEIPVINHFQTQGSSGGPAGILNVSFIEDVKLSSSAFDARFDNTLASVFQFKQREGNPDRISGNVRLSSTELATTLEGPINKKTNYLVSARRSYLQLLFQAIDLPIRPNYWDFQYKVTHKINAKTTFTAIGVGAIDEFSFGIPRTSTPDKTFILNATPSIKQWNYTTGFSLKKLTKNGFINIALSRNMFDNQLDRFENKDIGNENARILKIRSQEIENKLRIDVNKFKNNWKFSYGLVGQYVKFNNSLYNRIRKSELLPNGDSIPQIAINYESNIEFFKYGAFAQAAKRFFNDKLLISAGLRGDGNTYTNTGNNLLNTISPRLSISLALTSKLNLNASIGDYYKIPTYTVLGFKNNVGELVNKDTKYIRSTHYVAGFEYRPKESLRFTFEGFYKKYSNYPVSIANGISLANLGGGFDVLGNEAVKSIGGGETYGFEFYYQQKLIKKTFAVFSYTFVRSKFSGANGVLIASTWDNRHLISALFGYKVKRGWEIGAKFRFAGGTPYTPYDTAASRYSFATAGQGTLDYSQLNNQRLINFSQFDIRIDKKFYFKKATLDIYLDIQNLLRAKSPAIPDYTFKRNVDNTGFETTDGQPLTPSGSNGIPILLQDQTPLTTPALGFIFEF
jgi:outer membrane receptor for ferrienterochelin and colicin